jgi:ankyrin repeat protein
VALWPDLPPCGTPSIRISEWEGAEAGKAAVRGEYSSLFLPRNKEDTMRKLILSAAIILTVLVFGSALSFAGINEDMYHAVLDKDAQKVKYLLAQGADVNAQQKNWAGASFAPLYVASGDGSIEIVRMLLDKGADVNTKNIYERTALMEACAKGKKDVVLALLNKGAVVNMTSYEKTTPLMDAITGEGGDAAADIVKALLDKGADANYAKDGWTCLMYAAAQGKTEIVKLLLAKGVDVNKVKDGNSALSLASSRGYDEIARLLKAAGAK